MAWFKPWLLILLLPLLRGAQAQPSCRTKADCSKGQFCRFPDGECSAPGVCAEIPLFCTMEYQPVCGCDGQTYGNRCGAFGAGMSVRIDDECPPPPSSSSSTSSSSSSLPPPTEPTSGQKEEEEAGRQEGGHRHRRDLLNVDDWVSGEDALMLKVRKSSRSSSSDNGVQNQAPAGAGAGAAGAEVLSSQEPPRPSARSCGSRGLPACLEGEWCDFTDGTCGETDKGGVCRELQLACTRIYMPVCGCDGSTHANACVARSKEVSIRHEGPCSSPSPSSSEGMDSGAGVSTTAPAGAAVAAAGAEVLSSQQPPRPSARSCGSRGLPACLEGEWCDFTDGTCGETDKGGVCRELQLACTRIYMPVCGCDGSTHANACVARSKEVSIRHEGPCSSPSPSSSEGMDSGAGVSTTAPAGAAVAAAVETAAVEKEGEEEIKPSSFPPPAVSSPDVPPPDVPPFSPQTPPTPRASYPSLRDVWQALGGRGRSSERGSPCGGMMVASCPTGQVCIFPRGTCGAADEMGTCLSPPLVCALIYQPVCGCNGRTFSNECSAHASAVSVAAEGSCLAPIPDTDSDAAGTATAAEDGAGMLNHNGVSTINTAAMAAAGPAAAQKNVEEDHLRGGQARGGARRG